MMSRQKKYLLSILSAFLILPIAYKTVQGDHHEAFIANLDQIISEEDGQKEVPESFAIGILESYFSGKSLKASAEEDPEETISQKEFILAFEKLRLKEAGVSQQIDDQELYTKAWVRARRHNWLPNVEMNYETMQRFLYRYEVSRQHGNIPYFEGLVLDTTEINPEKYYSQEKVAEIQEKLLEEKTKLELLERPSRSARSLMAKIDENYTEFQALEERLIELDHPIHKLPGLTEEMKAKIEDNNLNQILDSMSYNYADNIEERQYNLTVGASKMHGNLYQPGEKIDFTKELIKDGWDDVYKYGWVIFGSGAGWAFGGGLCGSSTLTFTPSWRAGLEVIERFPHSTFYNGYYPDESFGLDAAIYRGGKYPKNLVMKNTTGSPLLFYVYDDKEKQEVTMYLVGNSPYVNIEIEGPTKIGYNTYRWTRKMEKPDGEIIVDNLDTRYNYVK